MESQSPVSKARCGVPNQDGTAWCLGPLRCAADSLGTMLRCRGIYKATIDGTVEFLGGIEDFTKHGHGGTWLKYGVNGINWRDTMIQPRDIGVVNQQKGWFQQLETVTKRGIPNQDVIPRTGQAMGPFFWCSQIGITSFLLVFPETFDLLSTQRGHAMYVFMSTWRYVFIQKTWIYAAPFVYSCFATCMTTSNTTYVTQHSTAQHNIDNTISTM